MVVVDTQTMLRGLLSRGGQSRRLLCVLAYGALAQRVDLVRVESEELGRLAREAGGELGGLSYEALVERASDAHARVGELLPVGAPDDWRLVISQPILDEYVSAAEKRGHLIAGEDSRGLSDERLTELRAAVAALAVEVVQPPSDVPRHVERDRDDDHFVHAALHADADVLISDDKHVIARGQTPMSTSTRRSSVPCSP